MKISTLFPRKKLRATTARRGIALPDDSDYEQMAEPNMKLSRALLIVLVLHVVAVAGIIAFNTIKTRERAALPPTAAASPSASASPSEKPAHVAQAQQHDAAPKPTHSPEKIIAKVGAKPEEPKRIEKAIPVVNSSKTYVVEKGDTPLKVAKKFHVAFDELMAANHIGDPHKLKVGQKLTIPTKPAPKAKKVTAD